MDLTGQRFGMLEVEDSYLIRNEGIYWLCRCDCGAYPVAVLGDNLISGKTTSCMRLNCLTMEPEKPQLGHPVSIRGLLELITRKG